jgi:hypothetical protein
MWSVLRTGEHHSSWPVSLVVRGAQENEQNTRANAKHMERAEAVRRNIEFGSDGMENIDWGSERSPDTLLYSAHNAIAREWHNFVTGSVRTRKEQPCGGGGGDLHTAPAAYIQHPRPGDTALSLSLSLSL